MEKDQLFILDKWIKSYLNEKKTLNLAKNTILNYKRVLDSFYEFYSLKDEENSLNSIYEINREFILEYLNSKGNISINTKNLHITVIKSFLSYISEHNKDNIDLTATLKGLSAKNVKSESESLSAYESELLEKYLLNQRYKKNFLNVRNRLLIKLLYYTGIRASELLSVTLEDITLLEEEGVYKIYIMGKGSKYRYVYIPVDLISDELTFIQEHFLEDEILHTKNSQRYIAVTQKGRVMHRAELYTMLDKLYKKLNIKKRGIHILRHTFGKRMVKKNVNLSTIKELMGHENIQTTVIYARSDEKGMIEAVLRSR
jgi:site-specific recombinase XerD